MNFLNKKHIPTFSQTNTNLSSHNTNSKQLRQGNSHQIPTNPVSSYINPRVDQSNSRLKQSPKTLYHNASNSRLRQGGPSFSSSYTGNYTMRKETSSANIGNNLCLQHQNQVLRHLCLQCNELLCSQCISDHLQNHRNSTNTIPKISTINKMKKQMLSKTQQILQFMQQSDPKMILPDINMLKSQALNKINQMKVQVIKAFEQWCDILQSHILKDMIKVYQIKQLSEEMGKLRQEVQFLNNQIRHPQSVSVETVKRIHKLDSQKLEEHYQQIFNKFGKSVLRSKFVIQYDWKLLMENFQKSIIIRPLHPTNQANDDQQQEDQFEDNKQRQSSGQNIYVKQTKISTKIQAIPYYDKKEFEIKSIQSLIEPSSQISLHDRLSNKIEQNISKQQQQKRGQRPFSRQGSGKRLSIFQTIQNKQIQIIQNQPVQNNE